MWRSIILVLACSTVVFCQRSFGTSSADDDLLSRNTTRKLAALSMNNSAKHAADDIHHSDKFSDLHQLADSEKAAQHQNISAANEAMVQAILASTNHTSDKLNGSSRAARLLQDLHASGDINTTLNDHSSLASAATFNDDSSDGLLKGNGTSSTADDHAIISNGSIDHFEKLAANGSVDAHHNASSAEISDASLRRKRTPDAAHDLGLLKANGSSSVANDHAVISNGSLEHFVKLAQNSSNVHQKLAVDGAHVHDGQSHHINGAVQNEGLVVGNGSSSVADDRAVISDASADHFAKISASNHPESSANVNDSLSHHNKEVHNEGLLLGNGSASVAKDIAIISNASAEHFNKLNGNHSDDSHETVVLQPSPAEAISKREVHEEHNQTAQVSGLLSENGSSSAAQDHAIISNASVQHFDKLAGHNDLAERAVAVVVVPSHNAKVVSHNVSLPAGSSAANSSAPAASSHGNTSDASGQKGEDDAAHSGSDQPGHTNSMQGGDQSSSGKQSSDQSADKNAGDHLVPISPSNSKMVPESQLAAAGNNSKAQHLVSKRAADNSSHHDAGLLKSNGSSSVSGDHANASASHWDKLAEHTSQTDDDEDEVMILPTQHFNSRVVQALEEHNAENSSKLHRLHQEAQNITHHSNDRASVGLNEHASLSNDSDAKRGNQSTPLPEHPIFKSEQIEMLNPFDVSADKIIQNQADASQNKNANASAAVDVLKLERAARDADENVSLAENHGELAAANSTANGTLAENHADVPAAADSSAVVILVENLQAANSSVEVHEGSSASENQKDLESKNKATVLQVGKDAMHNLAMFPDLEDPNGQLDDVRAVNAQAADHPAVKTDGSHDAFAAAGDNLHQNVTADH